MIRTTLATIGAGCLLSAAAFFALLAWTQWQDTKARRAKHADVDRLARMTRHLSSRRARAEQWHDVPGVDELGI
jgi:hypothetical protein